MKTSTEYDKSKNFEPIICFYYQPTED